MQELATIMMLMSVPLKDPAILFVESVLAYAANGFLDLLSAKLLQRMMKTVDLAGDTKILVAPSLKGHSLILKAFFDSETPERCHRLKYDKLLSIQERRLKSLRALTERWL